MAFRILHLLILAAPLVLRIAAENERNNLASIAEADPADQVKQHVTYQRKGYILDNKFYAVYCNNCTVDGDIVVSGGCDTAQCHKEPTEAFSALPFAYESPWMGAIFEDFSIHLDMNITLKSVPTKHPEGTFFDFLNGNEEKTTIPFKWNDQIDIDFELNPTILFLGRSTKETTFRYDFHLKTPTKGTGIYIHNEGPVAITGFSNSTITSTAYQPSPNTTDLSLELAFIPNIIFTGTIANTKLRSTTLQLQVPDLKLHASQVSNVDRNCNPGGSFNGLTRVVGSVSYFWYYRLGSEGAEPIKDRERYTLPTLCLFDGKAPRSPNRGSKLSGEAWMIWMVWGFVAVGSVLGLMVL